MKIAHIFNEVKRKDNDTKKFISPQEFDVDYISKNKGYSNKNYQINSDYDKLYYEALQPIKDGDIVSKYDENKINNFLEKIDNEVLMISGDFWGIQKFIFDSLSSKNASKILRSRSAMIQLITYALTDIIKEMFESEVVLFGAGKFLILAKPDNYEEKLSNLQKELDKYFIKNFFGQNGVVLSYKMTTKENINNQNSEKMKKDLIALGKQNELKKLNKFDIQNLEDDNLVIDIFKEVKKDDEICGFCNKRVAISKIKDEKVCSICKNQINLGQKLTTNRYMKIFKNSKVVDSIEILKYKDTIYYASFYNNETKLYDKKGDIFDISNKKYDPKLGIAKWPLSSFVAKENDDIISFEKLQENSNGLMALKADVDKLGDTFREFYMTSFKKFNRLSRELEFFFGNYVPYLIENNDEYNKKLYVIFAGGDDLFLIGEHRTIIKFAKDIREKFYEWTLKKATLSMGLVMFKHSTPITYISDLADEAEARAKNVTYPNQKITRDGIDIFGISMKFDEFINIEKEWQKVVNELEKSDKDTTSFYYRLIELSQMREDMKDNPLNSMWKSKLNYIFKRNLNKVDENIYKIVSSLIEKYGKKLHPSIFLTIYKNRDKINQNKGENR